VRVNDTLRRHFLQRAITGVAASLALAAAILQVQVVLHGNVWHLGTVIFYFFIFVLFILRRPSRHASHSFRHWICALGGVFLPFLLALNPDHSTTLFWISLPVQISGMVLSIVALSALGRSFGVIAAHRSIKTGGPYRLIRHPLYLGEALWFLSIVIQNLSWFNAALFCVQITCQLQRITEEESVLSQDPAYKHYMSTVSYRLVPAIF